MNCDILKNKIPQLLRKEVSSEERLDIINHVRGCTACRDEYKIYLRIFYNLDMKLVERPPKQVMLKLNEGIQARIYLTKNNYILSRFKWLLYPAAAILFVLVFLVLFITPDQSKINKENSQESLTEKLLTEEWDVLESVLSNRYQMADISNERIPISLLLKKLVFLQEQGIYKIKISNYQFNSTLIEPASGIFTTI
jgi:hypothetical protein